MYNQGKTVPAIVGVVELNDMKVVSMLFTTMALILA
jgi:hypothetical protein